MDPVLIRSIMIASVADAKIVTGHLILLYDPFKFIVMYFIAPTFKLKMLQNEYVKLR